jgi:hypothetical protein
MKRLLSSNRLAGGVVALILSAMACRLTFPGFSPLTTPNPDPTPTQIPLHEQVVLTAVVAHEESQNPNFVIDIQTPSLEGSEDKRVTDFNALMESIVQEEVEEFKGWMADMLAEPIVGGSFLALNFTQLSPPGNLLSIKFYIMFYFDGAAHPGHYSRTVTYDLENGKEVSLEQLFLAGVDYLGPISIYCIDALRERGVSLDEFWIGGAEPTTENYRNWNITADGLLITFDEYQVAPYVAGPQEVVVPYAELAAILDPNGPLAKILP